MKPRIVTKKYFLCVACAQHEFAFEHLHENYQTWWYCDDCGASNKVTTKNGELDVEIEPGRRKEKLLVTLELPPQLAPIRLEVRGMKLHGEGLRGEDEDEAYFYEEHTCPSNSLRAVQEVFAGDQEDPHGLLKYVSRAPWPKGRFSY